MNENNITNNELANEIFIPLILHYVSLKTINCMSYAFHVDYHLSLYWHTTLLATMYIELDLKLSLLLITCFALHLLANKPGQAKLVLKQLKITKIFCQIIIILSKHMYFNLRKHFKSVLVPV